jgi:hypothetical protein
MDPFLDPHIGPPYWTTLLNYNGHPARFFFKKSLKGTFEPQLLFNDPTVEMAKARRFSSIVGTSGCGFETPLVQ